MPKDMADVLRKAIDSSGLPLLTIAQETGVSPATLSEFMAGADMRLSTASKIAEYLKLELKPRPTRRR